MMMIIIVLVMQIWNVLDEGVKEFRSGWWWSECFSKFII